MFEGPEAEGCYSDREYSHHGEAPPCVLYAVEQVHAKETSYQCGEHEYYADRGHGLHH